MRWFQDRKGNVPMDAGSVAADFDMVLTFKSLPAWYSAMTSKQHQLDVTDRTGQSRVMMHSCKDAVKEFARQPLYISLTKHDYLNLCFAMPYRAARNTIDFLCSNSYNGHMRPV